MTMQPGNKPNTPQIDVPLQPTPSSQVVELSSPSSKVSGQTPQQKDVTNIKEDQPPKNSEQHASSDKKEGKDSVKEKKSRKISPRCYICRKVGMRLPSRQCPQCKLWYHLDCLKTKESKLPNKFLCGNCDPQCCEQAKTNQTSKKSAMQNKKLEKQKNRQVQLTHKFPPKQQHSDAREKNQANKMEVPNKFKQKYPYYVNQNRINFPIEDKLLYIYRELFDAQRPLPIPGESESIPSIHLGNMLIIENFCMSFEGEIEFSFLPTKQVIYSSFVKHPSDLCFKALLYTLLIIYLGDIFDRNKTENVRALNQNIFFQLLHFLKQNIETEQFMPRVWKQIVNNLEKIPSMAVAFDGLDKKVNIQTVQGKIHLIKQLIMGLSEVDQFHDMMYKKTDKKQDLTKERNELVAELKKDEAEILTQTQSFKQADNKIRDMQQQIDSSGKKQQVTKLTKELQKMKKAQTKLEALLNKLKQNVANIKSRISEINKAIPFITGEIQLLGRDRNESEYYLYSRECNRIYVNYKSSLLCQNPSFRVIKGKDNIANFIRYFNQKGIKEKQLFTTIQAHLKSGVINDTQYVYTDEDKMVESDTFGEQVIQLKSQDIVDVLNDCDEKFSTYLSKKNYRWINPTKKQEFKKVIQTTDVLILKEGLKFMQQQFLYVENLGNGQDESEDAKSEKGNSDNEEQIKKKRIRLWGIYFEKIKKYWVQYLDGADTLESVWVAATIFRHFVERYIKKKLEGAEEKQRKLEKELERERDRERERQKRQRHERLQKQRLDRYRQAQSSEQSQEESKHKPERPAPRTGRGRLVRKSERNLKHMNMKEPSSESDMYEDEDESESIESHEDVCEICGEFGDMLCCDTCPKVFHIQCLKLKQVPQGEWSCVSCLERIANERQTRSRTKRMYFE